MKICYLGNANSVHVHRWISYFANQGHTVHLISLKPADSFLLPGVQLHTLQVARTLFGWFYLKVRKQHSHLPNQWS